MEVGAVKQAFNNEVILLKKNLNQAKIHVIHKLTRKAKTLTEKNPPEHLKEKLKRKAESAVNEVLIMKKIKARDIAKFIITHTGEVKDFLNTPKVDNDKACARLVLHKSLQDKYMFIRNRFGNVPIKDLFMSRLERRKLKKEAREQQMNKKKRKEGKVVNAAGDWDVEDVEIGDDKKDIGKNEMNIDDERINNDESEHSGAEMNEKSDEENHSEVENEDDIENSVDENQNSQSDDDKSDEELNDNDETEDDDNHGNDDDEEFGKYIKLNPTKEIKKVEMPKNKNVAKIDKPEIGNLKPQKKQIDKKVKENKDANKKVKENKNKNLKEKLQNRKFKKDEDVQVEGRKVVDPFFITATGENYLSLAEPRQPDEVKEIHKQGNRKERRAAEFGHDVKRPRRDNFRQSNFRSNQFDRQDGNDESSSGGFINNDRFNRGPSFNDRNAKFNDRDNKFNDRNTKYNDRSTKFNDRNSNFDNRSKFNVVNSKFNNRSSNNSINEKKDEKLHPSWEAKKKLKSAMSLLPAQGKKIVFD